jgi:hypothetical protein
MKKLFLCIGLMGLSPIFAQETEIEITPDNSWLKAGLTAGVPVGEANDYASFNLGLDIRGQYLFNPNFAIGVASGYTHFFAKDDFEDFGVIPVAGFARYYFTPKGLFLGFDLGYGFLTNVEDNEGGLYVNPQIGYHNRDWNIYAFYQNTFAENDLDLQSVGVGVTYNIRFK